MGHGKLTEFTLLHSCFRMNFLLVAVSWLYYRFSDNRLKGEEYAEEVFLS